MCNLLSKFHLAYNTYLPSQDIQLLARALPSVVPAGKPTLIWILCNHTKFLCGFLRIQKLICPPLPFASMILETIDNCLGPASQCYPAEENLSMVPCLLGGNHSFVFFLDLHPPTDAWFQLCSLSSLETLCAPGFLPFPLSPDVNGLFIHWQKSLFAEAR